MNEIANSAATQHQMLRAIWPKWRAIAESTTGSDPERASAAIRALYRHLERPDPSVQWLDSFHRLPRSVCVAPVFPHVRENLLYSVWPHLRDPQWVCQTVGYDQHAGAYRLPLTMRTLIGMSSLLPRRAGTRPQWQVTAGNIISQLDADALAIFELARRMRLPIDPGIMALAEIIEQIVTTCFAVILFETTCLAVMKPKVIQINEAHQLSAQHAPAFVSYERPETAGLSVYAVNGLVLSRDVPPEVSSFALEIVRSPRERMALIEYMGWEAFLKLPFNRKFDVDRDRFGTLWGFSYPRHQFYAVEVVNRTREPNGRYRRYVIPVHPDLRPLPDPTDPRSTLGEPQEMTALNAVASTFGMTGEQYRALNLIES